MTSPDRVDLREKVARVIDPWGWDPAVAKAWGEDTCEIHAEQALAKADQILALIHNVSESGWRTIDSAPRDGTWVDLWASSGCRITARWVNETREVPSPNCVMDGWKDRSHDHYSCFVESYLTHWMPLQAPPSSGEPPISPAEGRAATAGLDE